MFHYLAHPAQPLVPVSHQLYVSMSMHCQLLMTCFLKSQNLLLVSLPRFERCVDGGCAATPRESAISLTVVAAVLDGAAPRRAIPHFQRAQGPEVYFLLHLQDLVWHPLIRFH